MPSYPPRHEPSHKVSLKAGPLAIAFLLLLTAYSCSFPALDTAPTDTPQTDCLPSIPVDGAPGDPYPELIEPFEITAPSGNTIYGMIRRPDPTVYPDLCFPAVVIVPGGINPGRLLAMGAEARMLAEAGMVVLTFNAEGRVDSVGEDIASEGTEDYNGFRHQDGLCKIVEYAMALPYVISGNVGIRTQSYGITMAAGCVGRHPELPVKYLVDGEGPPNSYVTSQEPSLLDDDPSNDKVEVVYGILGHYSTSRDSSPANLAFWEEREAERFIGAFRGRYLRLQATWDHAQPPKSADQIPAFNQPPLWWHNMHTSLIVNAAVSGGVPWVRVNLPPQGNPVGATFDYEHPPIYLPGQLADGPWAVRAILEMAAME